MMSRQRAATVSSTSNAWIAAADVQLTGQSWDGCQECGDREYISESDDPDHKDGWYALSKGTRVGLFKNW